MTIDDDEFIVGGDILLTLEDIPLINRQNLGRAWSLLQNFKSGDTVEATILRKGKVMRLLAKIPKR
ncbi:hypothetical protein [Maribacter aestuarii]|uniref:hypothetical protein n=1 Tax=Maribacter aestuarii TaxID=1130723 RepID=UPI00248B4E95|nr:hypothetical protein [Maribacter aestuarii]